MSFRTSWATHLQGELAQQSGILAAPPEHPDSIPNTHMVGLQLPVILVPGNLIISSGAAVALRILRLT